MKYLKREQFDRARRFVKTQARPLDRVTFEYRFEAASVEDVLAELAHFQNDDGGFGRALEPDMRTPSSSALATEIGLRVLEESECPAEHQMVVRAIQFLLATFDRQAGVWRVVPPDANAHPHAGWWHDEDGSLARTFDDFLVIPRAGLVGLLHHYSTLVPGDWLADLTERTVTAIETMPDNLFGGGGDGLRYALNLAQTDALPSSFKERLIPRLRDLTLTAVSRDPQKWTGYCAPPLKIAPSPQSLVVDLLGEDLQTHLDYQIEHQAPDGAWDPVWTWGDSYPDVWEQAKQEWRGHLTLETLTTLRAFGRIEG